MNKILLEKIIKEYEDYVEEKHKEFQNKYYLGFNWKLRNYEDFIQEIDKFNEELIESLKQINQEYKNGFLGKYDRVRRDNEW